MASSDTSQLRSNRSDGHVCPTCRGALRWTEQSATCAQCGEQYAISSTVPLLIPARAFQRYPVARVKDMYDRAHAHQGLMGTQFDPEYSRVTKARLLNFRAGAPNARVLDLGTGDGDLWQLADAALDWHGVDISETGMRRALERFPKLRGVAAIGEALPFADGYFGSVIAADTLEHAFDLAQTLHSIRRVLAAGGIFAFSVPVPNSLRKWGYNRIIRQPASPLMLLRLAKVLLKRTMLFGTPVFQPIDRDLPIEAWRRQVEQCGFQIEQVEQWPTTPLEPIVCLLAARVRPP